MGASDTAAVVVATASGLAIGLLLLAFVRLNRAVAELRQTVAELHDELVPTVRSLQAAVGVATDELDRVDGLLETAESISATVDSASRLAYVTFSNPLIKVLAFFSGTSRAARRLRRRGST